MANKELLQCYNRGCGQKYEPAKNTDGCCRHHPGEPFFHDAYKGWSCCNKKCTDFTEFLNIKGCTLSKHSNIKPVEPAKSSKDIPDVEITEVKPIQTQSMVRPPLDTIMTKMEPEIASSIKHSVKLTKAVHAIKDSSEIVVGTTCKNGGCTTTYEGSISNNGICTYHPGVPIFHEGLKFWSCCQRRTTDFNTFLSQIGCATGEHLWIKPDEGDSTSIKCRWDFHQTASHVYVSIYAKQYCPFSSVIKLNPIRLYANLVFPQETDSYFNLDIELNGIINIEESEVSMLGTKVEVKMKKAEPGSWPKLEAAIRSSDMTKKNINASDLATKIESVDLDDI